ncbi:MAG TPA: hypothetical protein VM688_07910 [Nocardioidaceae bacterium]|nr:hypothetical protein [Nocardioidaceae bacterium]
MTSNEHVLVRIVESHLGRLLLWIGVLLLVVLIYARETSPPSAWGPEDWSALAEIFIALILLLAIIIAAYELHDARELRRELARPYVLASLETDGTEPRFVCLVIRNLGGTAAEDVRLLWGPRPPRSREADASESPFPEEHRLPILVPGQEWRVVRDFGPWRYADREDTGETQRLMIQYTDSRSVQHHTESLLDWNSLPFSARGC